MKRCLARAAVVIGVGVCGVALLHTAGWAAGGVIRNHSEWRDTKGARIDCHEGGILRVGARYYWYGRSYRGNNDGVYGTGGARFRCGINCYSSENLVDWTFEGTVLAYPDSGWLTEGTWHRPRVVFNEKTAKYVLWFFCLGTPGGKPWVKDVAADPPPVKALPAGQGREYEGLSLARFRGKYIIAGSGVAGLNPTDTTYAVADAPMGPYVVKGLMSENRTWGSQLSSFFVIPETDTLFALCEQWLTGPDGKRVPAERSTQLWLPVTFDPETGTARMRYVKEWDPRQKQQCRTCEPANGD